MRLSLACHGRARTGDLSRFVEEVVQARILEIAPLEAKAENAALEPSELEAMV